MGYGNLPVPSSPDDSGIDGHAGKVRQVGEDAVEGDGGGADGRVLGAELLARGQLATAAVAPGSKDGHRHREVGQEGEPHEAEAPPSQDRHVD